MSDTTFIRYVKIIGRLYACITGFTIASYITDCVPLTTMLLGVCLSILLYVLLNMYIELFLLDEEDNG